MRRCHAADRGAAASRSHDAGLLELRDIRGQLHARAARALTSIHPDFADRAALGTQRFDLTAQRAAIDA